jgi:glycosyltransferase involved in cell wall biosynthesis
MKIVHLNTYNYGGASNAAKNLHLGLLKMQQGSSFLTLKSPQPKIANHYFYEELSSYDLPIKIKWLLNYYNRKKLSYQEKINIFNIVTKSTDWFSFISTPYYPENLKLLQNADIIHLHWVSDFINWSTFFNKLKNKALVWTLHDMNPFTGGYHYSEGFNGHSDLGLIYPYLAQTPYRDLVTTTLNAKKEILLKNNINLKIVAPSQWLANEAKKSYLFKDYTISVIPYGIDTEIFKYNEPKELRAKLKIDNNPVILVIADNLENKRKGYHLLTEALNNIKTRLNVLIIGDGKLNITSPLLNCFQLGRINSKQELSDVYNLADFFIICSLEDNLPNTVLESLSCGTPVIGFNTGGIPDVVVNNINGIIGEKSTDFLVQILDNLSNINFNKQSISKAARVLFSLENQASSYIQKIYC